MNFKNWRDFSVKVKLFFLLLLILLCMWAIILAILAHLNQVRRETGRLIDSNLTISRYINRFVEEDMLTEANNRLSVDPATSADYHRAAMETDRTWQSVARLEHNQDSSMQALLHAISQVLSHYRQTQLAFVKTDHFDEKAEHYVLLKQQASYIKRYNVALLEAAMRGADENWIEQSARQVQNSRLILSFIILISLFLIFSLRYFAKSFLKTVGQLGAAADAVRSGQYDLAPLPISSRDELGRTALSFNLMIEEIKQHIRTIEMKSAVERELLQKEVENVTMQKELENSRFIQLQSQINPHFLFNTLNTIASLADEEKAAYTEELIQRLARFFRYSLEQDSIYISLEQELCFSQNYMELQEARFVGQYSFESFISPDVDQSMSVPKFLIQPVLENAILHGVRKRKTGGKIKLEVRRLDGYIQILVSDNGVGFVVPPELNGQTICRRDGGTEEQRAGQYRPMSGVTTISKKSSIGLDNIFRRLQAIGGALRVISEIGKGTEVYLFIPEEH